MKVDIQKFKEVYDAAIEDGKTPDVANHLALIQSVKLNG